MYKGLYFKIILILVIFILIVMSVVGAVLISNVLGYYNSEFADRMEQSFAGNTQLLSSLQNAMDDEESGSVAKQAAILASYSSRLGIDDHRNYYILSGDGTFLAGSDAASGETLTVTQNLLSAMNGSVGNARSQGSSFADFALPLESDGEQRIIYIRDTQEELRDINWMLFTIILQALFIGLIIAFVLSFFLARAISLPLAKLTYGVQRVASGDFKEKIPVHSDDEIGVLTENFNRMSSIIEGNIDEINGEREKLETVLSCLKDAVVTFGSDGKLLQINDAAKNLFSDIDLTHFSLDYIFSLLHYDFSNINIDMEENAGVPAVQYKNRDFELYFGNIRYRASGGMNEGVIIVIHDVTQSYELERGRREFVANVSHELRTPLTTIRMVVEALAADEAVTVSETNKSFLEMAENESTRMEMLIKDLLTLSQLDQNTAEFRMRNFDIAASLRSTAKMLEISASAKNHTLTLEGCETEVDICGDPVRIEQIIINIVSNAIKYTPDGGKLHVQLENGEHDVRISVTDNGIGIPEEDIAHLFERFYRVEKARSSDKGGTGLGLAIANEFAKAHGGKIQVNSIVGRGTCFIVTLPKRPAKP